MSNPSASSASLLWWLLWLVGIVVLVAVARVARRNRKARSSKLVFFLVPWLEPNRTKPAVSRWAGLFVLAGLVFVLIVDWLSP